MIFVKHKQGFKIKSKKDAELFLTYCLGGEGTSTFFIDKQHCFFIRIIKIKSKTNITIAEKVGDLYDVFNPEIIIPESQMIDYVYKMRKYINTKFFTL